MQNILVDIAIALRTLLGPFAYVPWSAVTVLVVSILVSFFSNMVNKRLIDYDRLRRNRAEVNKWQEMKREASRTTDERVRRKLLLKVKRRERYITKLQGEIGKQSFMPMIVTIVPLLLVFAIMNGIFYDDTGTVFPGAAVPGAVIISPLNFSHLLGGFGLGFGHQYPLYGIPLGAQGLLYVFWYFICSFLMNMIWQRVLGTSMSPT
ncbi:MAG: EMC3/TMCO1 family protein [Promethearchaeota archaeon]